MSILDRFKKGLNVTNMAIERASFILLENSETLYNPDNKKPGVRKKVHCFQMCTFLLDGYISAIVATDLCFLFSLLGLQQGTLAEHYTSASPVAATNTNQVLSETDFLRRRCCGAQYNLENNNGRLRGAACSPDSEM